MNRRELEQYLREQGCEFHHRGGKHDIWCNPETGALSPIPRHKTIKKGTARGICRILGVPKPNRL